jgi:phthalate 4,5-dioxygenase
MLSVQDNERITRTGPGTPMGEVFRRFWVPALLSSELADADAPPLRFLLLGERLIAFRDSDGRIGLLEEQCPHRHASLYWGRNEDAGLRCVYHGWKFGVDGTCLDMPAEPAGSRMKDGVRAVAYETHEAGGIIWAYLGPKDKIPPFPHFEWTLLPADHSMATKRLQVCNYLQNLEGELDTAHANFLHREFGENPVMPPPEVARKRFLIAETDFGMLSIGRSDLSDEVAYWRITPFHLPSFTLIPSAGETPYVFTGAVPLDDTHMWGFTVTWSPDRPLDEKELAAIRLDGVHGGVGPHVVVDPVTFRTEANLGNDYLIDRDLQRTGSFTGIPGTRVQDMAVQEDQDGPICLRHKEHLGTTDRGIVGARRLLLRLAEQLEQGIEPPQPQHADSYRIHSVAAEVPPAVDPIELWHSLQPVPAGTTTIEPAR